MADRIPQGKPSGPGFLFVGRFLITDPISSLVMGLFKFSISSCLSFWKCVGAEEFVHFFQVVPFVGL